MNRRLPYIIHLSASLAFATIANAQITHVPLYTFNGDNSGDRLGFSVSGAGDVNNDGYSDYIIGAPGMDKGQTSIGYARVYSGFDGSILHIFDGDDAQDFFGRSVSGAGDVNNDGFDDLIIGAPSDGNNGTQSGMARVYSGIDGSVLYTFNGDSPQDFFGNSVSGGGDVNNDGYDDLIVGAAGDDNNASGSGSARVFSGFDGSILYTFNGDNADDALGGSVSLAGDVNNDGYDDLFVGIVGDDNNGDLSGSARVYSGFDGSILYTFDGDSAGDRLGNSVSGAGDVNNDGYDDLVAGAYFDDNNGAASGSARVYSGFDGAILYTVNGDNSIDELGYSVSRAGDINNDGYDDFIAGAPFDDNNGMSSGIARVYSGLDGSELYTFSGDNSSDQLGYSVTGAGDVNDDGYDDLVVGIPFDFSGVFSKGKARVFVSMMSPPLCTGDVNDDQTVDVDDLNAILSAWGTSVGQGDPRDLANNDGVVDVDDLNVVLANWGNVCQ
ncbi:MAG: FG-GAP repeat protein [Phycisphaeraceae bacterium]|nr:FG-GAP repeat protein [Phycisphaeraceae bacterium]